MSTLSLVLIPSPISEKHCNGKPQCSSPSLLTTRYCISCKFGQQMAPFALVANFDDQVAPHAVAQLARVVKLRFQRWTICDIDALSMFFFLIMQHTLVAKLVGSICCAIAMLWLL